MTLFGTTLDGVQIASLVGLLAALIYWMFVLRGEQNALSAFRKWEADRKARRDAEIAAEEAGVQAETPPSTGPKRGPWG